MKAATRLLLCALLTLPLPPPSFAQTSPRTQALPEKEEPVKLLPGDGEFNDQFGLAVAISGNTIVVGARRKDGGDALPDSGAAYIFERPGRESTEWRRVKKIEASDRTAGAEFGSAVAISGSTIVVGAHERDRRTGAVYLFERNAGGENNWGEVRMLQAPDGAAGDRFGWSVAVSGTTVAIGALADDDRGADSGSVYLFERDAGGDGHWGLVKKLTALDGGKTDNFGRMLALSAHRVVVAAPSHNRQAGAAYLFERNAEETCDWKQTAKIQASDARPGNFFGGPVALQGDRLVAGGSHDSDIVPKGGSAYVFERAPGGHDWVEVQRIRTDDPKARDYFGTTLALHADQLVGGSLDEESSHAGAVYLFEREAGAAGEWTQKRRITAPDPLPGMVFITAALDDGTLVVGAHGQGGGEAGHPLGVAFVFATGLPRFADYPAGEAFSGKPALPRLASPEARRHRTMIQEDAKAGPNFAGHYTLAMWGCGSTCVGFAVVDARTGEVYFHPTVSQASQAAYQAESVLQFRPDSRLLVVAGVTEGPAGEETGRFYYEWKDNRFSLLRRTDVRLEEGAPVLPPCPALADAAPQVELDTLCAGIDNSYECAQAVEHHQLQQPGTVAVVQREGARLRLRLRTGEWLTIEDTRQEGDEEASDNLYSFREYLTDIGYFLLHRQLYEGADYLMIHDSTGARQLLPALPVVSPDRQRLVVASDGLSGGYGPNVVEIWRLTEDKLELEHALEPDEWAPSDPEWIDNHTLRLTKKYPPTGDTEPRKEHVLLKLSVEWRAEPAAPEPEGTQSPKEDERD